MKQIGALLIAVAGIAVAQTSVTFRDNGGNMELRNFASFGTTQSSDGGLRFQGSGRPLIGNWRRQGLELTGRTVRGVAIRQGNQYLLSSATLSGGARATIRNGDRQSVLETAAIDIRMGSSPILQSRSAVAITDRSGSQTMLVKGSSGQASFSDRTLRSASLSGSVTLDLRRSGAGATTIRASGGRVELSLSGSARTIVLVGSVKISGDGTAFSGEAQVGRATIRLDSQNRPVGVELQQ
jgi:hypothetical protein